MVVSLSMRAPPSRLWGLLSALVLAANVKSPHSIVKANLLLDLLKLISSWSWATKHKSCCFGRLGSALQLMSFTNLAQGCCQKNIQILFFHISWISRFVEIAVERQKFRCCQSGAAGPHSGTPSDSALIFVQLAFYIPFLFNSGGHTWKEERRALRKGKLGTHWSGEPLGSFALNYKRNSSS